MNKPKAKATKTIIVPVRLLPRDIAKLRTIAERQTRTASNLGRAIIERYLQNPQPDLL